MDVKRRVTDIWNDVLGSDGSPASQDPDFFEAGGDSFAVIEFASRVKDEIGIEFPLEVIFTSGSLAAVIDECQRRASGSGIDIDPS